MRRGCTGPVSAPGTCGRRTQNARWKWTSLHNTTKDSTPRYNNTTYPSQKQIKNTLTSFPGLVYKLAIGESPSERVIFNDASPARHFFSLFSGCSWKLRVGWMMWYELVLTDWDSKWISRGVHLMERETILRSILDPSPHPKKGRAAVEIFFQNKCILICQRLSKIYPPFQRERENRPAAGCWYFRFSDLFLPDPLISYQCTLTFSLLLLMLSFL